MKHAEEEKRARIADRLQLVESRLPLKRLYVARGMGAPPRRATISGSPRIVITLRGENRMWIPDGEAVREVTLVKNEAVYIEQDSWNAPEPPKPVDFYTLDFQNQHTRYYDSQGKEPWSPGQRRVDAIAWFRYGPVSPEIAALLRTTESLARSRHDGGDGAKEMLEDQVLTALVESIVRLALRDLQLPAGDLPGPRSRQHWSHIAQFIDDHLHEPLGRRELAREFQIHPNHLSRIATQNIGESLPAFLNRRRVERAAKLLRNPRLSVKEIAVMCGFVRPNHFARVFHRMHGKSPTEYRRTPI